jgi:hypothetical protein
MINLTYEQMLLFLALLAFSNVLLNANRVEESAVSVANAG